MKKTQAVPQAASHAGFPDRGANGADATLRVLEQEGVTICFGIPGRTILPVYDAIARGTTIRHVLARHEQGAGHIAEGFARASGEVGVAIASSGPAAANLVTPIANAAMDSTPLLCITGNTRSAIPGVPAPRECDILSAVGPLAKFARRVRAVEELPAILREALGIAREGRPGPALVEIPLDVQEAAVPAGCLGRPASRRPRAEIDVEGAGAVARAIEAASRPILLAGGGVVNADAGKDLVDLAERGRIPVVTTLMGKGAVPASHELNFECPGMHGGKWATWGLNMADLIVAVGTRFDAHVTGRLDEFAPAARVAHFDIDQGEIGRLRRAELPVSGQLPENLRAACSSLRQPADSDAWIAQLHKWRERFPLSYEERADRLKPQRVLQLLDRALAGSPDVIWTTGVGLHQMWAMQYLSCESPRSFLTSGGHGTMGYGLPAAIGARAARPDAAVVCVDGDGSFAMTCQEVATAVAEQLPVVVVVLNNRALGMVRQWQTMLCEGRLSQVDLGSTDYAVVARGFGARAWTVVHEDGFEAALAEALDSGETCVLDVWIEADEGLFPIIRPGAAAVDVIEHRPDWQIRLDEALLGRSEEGIGRPKADLRPDGDSRP